ncbi:hypothetical protein DFJ77DRAFT_477944 [Powellomyces hirtus]|nr:hypothetical protein DFJ77DRAFT_477944 [Powellomyces hirtus]
MSRGASERVGHSFLFVHFVSFPSHAFLLPFLHHPFLFLFRGNMDDEDFPNEQDLEDAWDDDYGDEFEALEAMQAEERAKPLKSPPAPRRWVPDFFSTRQLQDAETRTPFSSSPPTFTSPTSRMDQPSPMPSDFDIYKKKVAPAIELSETTTQKTALSFGEGESWDDSVGSGLVGGLVGSDPFGAAAIRRGAGRTMRRNPLTFSDDSGDDVDVNTRPNLSAAGSRGQSIKPARSAVSRKRSRALTFQDDDDAEGHLLHLPPRQPPLPRDSEIFDVLSHNNHIDELLVRKGLAADSVAATVDARKEIFDNLFASRHNPDIASISSSNNKKRASDPSETDIPSRPAKRLSSGGANGDPDEAMRLFNELGDVLIPPSRRSAVYNDDDSGAPLLYPQSEDEDDNPFKDRFSKSPARSSAIEHQSSAIARSTELHTSSTNIFSSTVRSAKRVTTSKLPQLPIRNYTYLPRDTNRFRLATASSGTSLYFPLKKNLHLTTTTTAKLLTQKPKLLSTSIYTLLEDLEKQRTREAEDESASEFIAEQCRLRGQSVLSFNENGTVSEPVKTEIKQAGKKDRLWVDKYSPRMYIDLIGDERINRDVLTWVKEWDFCVFKKPRKLPAHKKFESLPESFNKDPLQRPDKKVLLLTGPPGLGKTTLAHVIARHAGYSVSEINASDDRTGDSIKTRLVGALETQSVLGAKRPHLVVIDEIDGASSTGQGDQNFIKLLIDFITGDAKASVRKGAEGAARKQTKRRPLLRPIICICNDPYAPVLRPLRHLAHIINFRPPPTKLLAKRLHEICRWEALHADLRTLTHLCELTDGDMRSCLNSLQFLKRKTNTLTLDAITGADVGQKDVARGLFVIWQEIFGGFVQRGKKKVVVVKERGDDQDDTGRYIQRLHTLIAGNGEYDKIIQGCHENYLRAKIFDTASLPKPGEKCAVSVIPSDVYKPRTKIDQACDWLAFFDTVHHTATVKHGHEVGAYMAYAAVSFHRLFASAARVRLEYPRQDAALFVGKQATRNVLVTVLHGLPPHARRTYTDPEKIMVHLVSHLVSILSPELRPVNARLAKQAESATLTRLVDVMTYLGIRYRQDKGEDGVYHFYLDPPIDILVKSLTNGVKLDSTNSALPLAFSNKRVLGAADAVKQMVAHEIEREIMCRAEAAAVERANATTAGNKQPSKKGVAKPQIVKGLKAVEVEKEMAPRDFFGRLLVVPEPAVPVVHSDMAVDGSRPPILRQKGRIAFRFNEGFSNAVRKPVLIRELM